MKFFFFYLTSKSIINYLKLFIIKFLKLTLGKKNDKYFDNKMFFGLIGSGIQNEFLLKKIIKLIKKKKINKEILILFHPFKIDESEIKLIENKSKNLNFYSSYDRKIEINFLEKIKTKSEFLKKCSYRLKT